MIAFRPSVVDEAPWVGELQSVLWAPKSLLKYFKWDPHNAKHIPAHHPCFISLKALIWSDPVPLSGIIIRSWENTSFPRTSLLVTVLPALRTRPTETPPAETQTMITHGWEQNPQAQDTNCSKQLRVCEGTARDRTRHRREEKKKKRVSFQMPQVVTAGGQKVWEFELYATSLMESWREPPTRQPSHRSSGPSCWSTRGRSQSSEGLSGWRAPSHTWVCAAPSSWGRKLCSDIKQSVSITVPETAGMMSGPHKGSG